MGSYVSGYTSPAAAAREVFKPSADSARLTVPSQKKKKIQFWVWGSLGGRHVFMAYFTRPWKSIEWAHILSQVLFSKIGYLTSF